MSTLTDKIAAEHLPTSTSACTCGAMQLGESYPRHVAEVTEHAVRAHIALQAAIRSAALFESAWDKGNAMGLDGWIGPERGEKPDDHAITHRERTVDRLVDDLRARIAEGSID